MTREPTTAYMNRHAGPIDLVLVVEVSDTSLLADLVVKARFYARAGIVEYWVLDLNARQLHIHRLPADGEYSLITIHSEFDSVTISSHPNLPVAITDLLPPVIT